MEVSETATGQNVQKSSSSTSESVNETVVKTDDTTKVANGEAEASATITVAPAQNGTDKTQTNDEVEEIVEVIEVTDDESGEEVIEEVIVTTAKSVSQTPKQVSVESSVTVTKQPSVEASVTVTKQPSVETSATVSKQSSVESATVVIKQATVDTEKVVQKPVEVEESASEEEVEEEEIEVVTESKVVSKQASLASEVPEPSKAEIIEAAEKGVVESVTKAEAAVAESMAQMTISEKPAPSVSDDLQARRASVAGEPRQRSMQHAAPIPQTAPIQQTAPMHQVALIQQSVPSTHMPAQNYTQQAATPYQPQHQIPQENIRNQLQEIVSDIDRAVQEHKIYSQVPPTVQSYVTTQNSSSTQNEMFKKTTSSAIYQQPNYYYQEDNASTTTASTKPIDLQKIFTPAPDADVILPNKNRKLYASSAFFTPGLHPTVEDQVELARLISSSLSDSNNKQSKGQTMYVNRKKRSVKWVHEGEGKNENINLNGFGDYQKPSTQFSEEKSYSSQRIESKIPLKLVMDPRGVVQDVHTQGITYDHSSGMLSPDKCAELVSALHTDAPKGKGAELFAKRRKRSEKWIVDETTRSANNPALTSYSAGPTQIYDTNQYNQANYRTVDNQATYQQQSWETQRNDNLYSSSPSGYKSQYQPGPMTAPAQPYTLPKQAMQPMKRTPNNLRDLAYKPSIPQGWNAPPAQLPNEMFTPPEIPLSGYSPPRTDSYLPPSTTSFYPHQYEQQAYVPPSTDLYQPSSGTQAPPSFRKIDPSQVYGAQFPVQNFTPKPFTPSPIAQEKLAIFEGSKPFNAQPVIRRPLTAPNQRVRNVSPAPFTGGQQYDSYSNAPWSAPQSNRLSGSFASSPSNYNPAPSSVPMSVQQSPRISTYDSGHQENFNRAARGWGQSRDFYRPISFNQPQYVELPYSDF